MDHDNSILMQKQVRDNSEDLRSEFLDLKNWEEQMKRKEQEILSERNGQQIIPPVRNKNKKKKCAMKENETSKNSKRIKSHDYASWDKFDVDKACKELEDEEQSDESSDEPLSKEELQMNHSKAIEYKQQGNDFVKQKKWDKAIASYSEAIKLFPYDAIFYANRALCYLKQNNLYSAEADCSSAIQLDKTYVKAYYRRVTARLELKQFDGVIEDIKKITDLDPHSKETETLVNQVRKQLKNSFMSEKDDENKKINKKVDIKEDENKKNSINVVDIKEDENKKNSINVVDIKEDENKKNSINVDNTVKPTNSTKITEPRKARCIPDWLPEKDNVEIVEPIDKLPHLRSKEPLKRIPVQEADLSKSFKEKVKVICNKNQIELKSNETCKLKENFIEDCEEIPPIPTSAVQFLINWKRFTSFDFRYRYLKQIPSGSLPKIFQDSMETDIFSDILTTLKTEFTKRNEPIFSYLKDLSNIKRFRAFIMFINNSEKQDLKFMFSYCNTSEKIPEKEIIDLQNKYEI